MPPIQLSPQDRDGVFAWVTNVFQSAGIGYFGETLAICAALTAPALTFGI